MIDMLPAQQKAYFTDGYDGFNHIHHLEGNCEEATLEYIIRNHNLSLAKKQINDFKRIKKYLDEKYGYELINLEINESYLNMAGNFNISTVGIKVFVIIFANVTTI